MKHPLLSDVRTIVMQTETLQLALKSNYYASLAQSRKRIYGVGKIIKRKLCSRILGKTTEGHMEESRTNNQQREEPAWSPQADMVSVPQISSRVLTRNIVKNTTVFALGYRTDRDFKSVASVFICTKYRFQLRFIKRA
jgi:hypothetical protein